MSILKKIQDLALAGGRPQLPIQNLQNLLGGVGDAIGTAVTGHKVLHPQQQQQSAQHINPQFQQPNGEFYVHGTDLTNNQLGHTNPGQWQQGMGGAPMTHPQEDDVNVWGPRGVEPLNRLNAGEPWQNFGGIRRPQEDDGYVAGPRGIEQLNRINPGEPWSNLPIYLKRR